MQIRQQQQEEEGGDRRQQQESERKEQLYRVFIIYFTVFVWSYNENPFGVQEWHRCHVKAHLT
jgi:hypothetical protein